MDYTVRELKIGDAQDAELLAAMWNASEDGWPGGWTHGVPETGERILEARLPEAWPGRALIERAFSASLENIRKDPDHRLWGDRVMIAREGPRRVIGSVVFHGGPGEDGLVEVAYGVEQESQQQGYATEGTRLSLIHI